MAVYLLVFGVILDKSGGIPHYPLYLLSGIACWIFFAVSLQTAARSMVDSAELIKKVRFPRQLVAFSVVATQAVTFAVMLAILIVLSLDLHPGRARRRSGSRSRSPSLFVGARRRASRSSSRALNVAPPRRRAHPRRGAPAVVLPDADPLELRDAAGLGDRRTRS